MNKKWLAVGLAACLLGAGTAHANWITGDGTQLDMTWGNTSYEIGLTSEQRVLIETRAANKGLANFTFTGAEDSGKLILSDVPVKVETESADDGQTYEQVEIKLIPLIQTDNGARYYIMDTDTPGGCRIVHYEKGAFTTAFEASSIPGDWEDAEIEVNKKQLILQLEGTDGAETNYQLVWDKDAGQFNAEPVTAVDDDED